MKRSEIDWDKEIEKIKKNKLTKTQRDNFNRWAKNIYSECDDDEFPDIIFDEIYHEAYLVALGKIEQKNEKKLEAIKRRFKEIDQHLQKITSLIRGLE